MTPKKNPSEKPGIVGESVRYDITLLSEDDLYLFNEGRHFRLYQKLGAHVVETPAAKGLYFAVWAPNALRVSVVGDFNDWHFLTHPLQPRGQSGIWEGFIGGLNAGTTYKFHVESKFDGYHADKADPLSFQNENAPRTASIANPLVYRWSDAEWMQKRVNHTSLNVPISIYELHLGSWKRVPEENNRPLTYREIAPQLADYINRLGFTHVELMPIMDHPFYGSWGYQVTGYFAASGRYGSPQDLMYLIDYLHQKGIGVILDWVPSHFPDDIHGLNYFDGTHLYEHADPKQRIHPDWGSLVFNYSRHEVRSFLISSALFWLDKYHADGLRVDAVASMLYLDYSRQPGEWAPNVYGGHENLDAMSFLRQFNEQVYAEYPGVQTYAEESTAWPMVSRPTYLGGLGFGFKWDMGWMHDTLRYLAQDPLFRKYHHNEMTFRGLYALTENFILPLSHDEVVHGKRSLLSRMPGWDTDKFANLRLLFGYMFAQTGKKLLFMGGEFGQRNEWDHETSLEWHLLQYAPHQGIQKWVTDLNRLYRAEKALFEADYSPNGFEWIDANDVDRSTFSFLRKSADGNEIILAVFNCTPVPLKNYRVGVPRGGEWRELLNSDAEVYGGFGNGNGGRAAAENSPNHGQPFSLNITLPALGVLFFKNPQ